MSDDPHESFESETETPERILPSLRLVTNRVERIYDGNIPERQRSYVLYHLYEAERFLGASQE